MFESSPRHPTSSIHVRGRPVDWSKVKILYFVVYIYTSTFKYWRFSRIIFINKRLDETINGTYIELNLKMNEYWDKPISTIKYRFRILIKSYHNRLHDRFNTNAKNIFYERYNIINNNRYIIIKKKTVRCQRLFKIFS